jgi:hypothetical protein
MNDKFKFDPNSTKNEGRWRLIDPEKFTKGSGWFRKKNPNYPGISYVFGNIKNGKTEKQTIRFDKSIFTEEKASEWWEEHKKDYERIWTEEDWKVWVKEKKKKETKKQKPKNQKITRRRALLLSKKIIELLGAKYVPQKDITIDTEFSKNIGFPAGSVRQGEEEVGDLDIVLTKSITRRDVEEIKNENITNLTGNEKFIKFIYHFGTKKREKIGIDVFIFKEKETWGAALLHVTGPRLYNIYIRKKVKSFGEGWTLSQNGLVNGFDEIIPTPTERILQNELNIRERTPDERREFRKK